MEAGWSSRAEAHTIPPMSLDLFWTQLVFAFVGSISPGPNNFLLLTSGVNFGFRRTLPHVWGGTLGFMSLLLAVGLGLGALLTLYPPFHLALKIGGGTYLLYLAWKIASARAMSDGRQAEARPLTFLQAALFAWMNPKAWVTAVAAMAIYTDPARPFLSVLSVTGTFFLAGLPSAVAWALFGIVMRDFLADPVRLKWFNIAMGLLLAATLWPLLK